MNDRLARMPPFGNGLTKEDFLSTQFTNAHMTGRGNYLRCLAEVYDTEFWCKSE